MPLDSKPLLWGSVALLVVGLVISLPIVFTHVMWIDMLRVWIMEHSDKTNLDLLQYAHFLASAYVAVVILKGREAILLTTPLRPFVKCGQQALAVFLSGMVLSHIGGMVFDHLGTEAAVQLAVNGVASFKRSGTLTIPSGAHSVTHSGIALKSSSMVFAMIQAPFAASTSRTERTPFDW